MRGRRIWSAALASAAAACILATAAVVAQGSLASPSRTASVAQVPEQLEDPAGLGRFFFGPRLSRAEIVVTIAGVPHVFRIDRGRARSVGPDAIELLERDGTIVSIPVNPAGRIRVNGRAAPLTAIRRGATVTTVRDGDSPAAYVAAVSRRR